jgi:TRAP-type uncharacterized transport system substrate-binding protein
VAVVGSASLVARKIDRALGFNINFIDASSDDEAFGMVKAGRAAAAMTVSGWPSGPIAALKQSDGLALVPVDITISPPYFVKSVNYSNLGVYNLNLIAAPNMLVTRPFQGSKAGDVAALKSCIAENLLNLKEGSYQPGWKEDKDLNMTYDIPKFQGQAAQAMKRK